MTRSAKTRGRPAQRKRSPLIVPVIIIGVVLIGLVGWSVLSRSRSSTATPSGAAEMPHIHGMGFSADGRQLIIAAHDGVRVFADGAWVTPDIPPHDYMGYSPTDNGFYSSGHPHTAGLVNPFGLVKSTDGGKTLTRLGFEGESDFHVMGVGYASHTIYVLNSAPNSRLQPGLYSSTDDGKTWKAGAMQGVTTQPIQIAVHPTDSSIVALAAEGGLFLSTDAGAAFSPIRTAGPVAAAAFHPNGTKLFFAGTTLSSYDLAAKHITALPMPANAGNGGVSAIAINPARPDEIAFATFERNIYFSQNGGQSWKPIAQAGKGIPLQ